jgi:hypothetical protein
MNSEIKFRAYGRDGTDEPKVHNWEHIKEALDIWLDAPNTVIIQYTGIDDINGEEIYEDDKVIYTDSFNNKGKGIVKYGKHLCSQEGGEIRTPQMGVYLVNEHGGQIFDKCRDSIPVFNLERIGSIWEDKNEKH